MDEKMLKTMVAAGAIKKISIIANGARFHIEANTPNGPVTAETQKGKIKTWVTLDPVIGSRLRTCQPRSLAAGSERVSCLTGLIRQAASDPGRTPNGSPDESPRGNDGSFCTLATQVLHNCD